MPANALKSFGGVCNRRVARVTRSALGNWRRARSFCGSVANAGFSRVSPITAAAWRLSANFSGVRSNTIDLPVLPSSSTKAAAPRASVLLSNVVASSNVCAFSKTARTRSGVGRAARAVVVTSPLRTGWTLTAMPAAFMPARTPACPAHPTPAHANFVLGCAMVTTGTNVLPDS